MACGGSPAPAPSATNSPSPAKPEATKPGSPATPGTAVGGDSTKIAPTIIKKEDGPDNSRITVKQVTGGEQMEVRNWTAGPVEKLTRFTNVQKKRILRVRLRDGSRFRLDDPQAVEHALDWSGEQIADAARKLGKPVAAKGGDKIEPDDEEEGEKAPAATDGKQPS